MPPSAEELNYEIDMRVLRIGKAGLPGVFRGGEGHGGDARPPRALPLVYGGGRTGLMGALADSALANGGEVVGVITEGMNAPELARPSGRAPGSDRHHPPEENHYMYALADGYIALPGGYGTLDRAVRDARLGAGNTASRWDCSTSTGITMTCSRCWTGR